LSGILTMWGDQPLRLVIPVNQSVLVFVTAISFAAALLSGVAPALRATRGDVLPGLQQGTRTTSASPVRRVLGRSVAVVQLALSMVLVGATCLFAYNLHRLRQFDSGVTREHLLVVIDTDLFWLTRSRAPFRSPAWYIDQLDPDVYLNREYAPLAQRLQGYIGYARAIPKIAAAIRANLATPMPQTFIERGIAGFGGYADFYRNDVERVFAAVKDPKAQQELRAADVAAAAQIGQ